MSQQTLATIDPTATSGTALANLLSLFGAAWETLQSGSTAPSFAKVGTPWVDTSVSPPVLRLCYQATPSVLWIPLLVVQAAQNGKYYRTDTNGVPQYVGGAQLASDIEYAFPGTAKSGAYSMLAADQGKVFLMTGTWVLTLPNVSTISAGFKAELRNTGAGTISVTPFGSETIEGLTSYSLPTGSSGILFWDGTNWWMLFVSTAGSVDPTVPGLYLTLTSGTPVPVADVTAATNVFWAIDKTDRYTWWTGANWTKRSVSQLTLALVSNHLASTLYDVFVAVIAGVDTLVTGPAWATSTPGAGSRGAGAGTTQVSRLGGIWVNALAITGRNGSSTFSIPANQGIYLGTILIDGTAGQISQHVTFGQSRKPGPWNAYNRKKKLLQAGDSTANWTPPTTLGPINANSANSLTTLCGLAEEPISAIFNHLILPSMSSGVSWILEAAIGLNSTTTASGFVSSWQNEIIGSSLGPSANLRAELEVLGSIGANILTALEVANHSASVSSQGYPNGSLLKASWQG